MADVGLVLLADADHHRRPPHVAGDEGGLLESALDGRHRPHADEGAVCLFEHDGVEDFFDGLIVASRADRRLALRVLKRAGREVLVLRADAIGDVAHGQTEEARASAIDEDVDLALLEAADLDARNALDLAHARLDLLRDVAQGQRTDVARVVHHDVNDLALLGDDLPEARLFRVQRKLVRLVHRAADVVHRGLVVDGVEGLIDVDVDHRQVGLRRRADLLDVVDRDELVLELRGHEPFDLVGGGTGPRRRHDDLVEHHVVEVLDLGQLECVPAADHADEEEDVDENRLADAELGEGHRTSTRIPLRSWSTAVTMTLLPSSRPRVIWTRSGRKGTGRVCTRTRCATSPSSSTKT